MKSESIANLAAALAKAQAVITGAVKDADNPFFKSKYADLATVLAVGREPLTANGLSVAQMPVSDEQGRVGLHTTLMHTSGEWIDGTVYVAPSKPNDPQVAGSILTYLRRYAYASVVGIPQVDDDGEAAAQPTRQPVKATAAQLPAVKPASTLTLTEAQQTRLKALMKEHGVKASAVKAMIEQAYPIKTAADIRQTSYDDICAFVVAGGGDAHE